MPIYEYRCSAGHDHDGYATVERRHESKVCPACGAQANKVILHAPRVFGDYEGYLSPVSGRWVEGRRARIEDLRATGCRPYEEGEARQATKTRTKVAEEHLDRQVDAAVEKSLWELTSE